MFHNDLSKGLSDDYDDGRPALPPLNWTPSKVAEEYSPGEIDRMMKQTDRQHEQLRKAAIKQRKGTGPLG